MIEDKIEIHIPTYNRAQLLDNTLNSLLNSPFKDCKIIIRDDASIDETPEICEKYSKLFKNVQIVRNRKNRGLNANTLRSYEEATLPYVWVLADNDFLNFDGCDDFIEAIESEKYAFILCSSSWYAYKDNKNPTFETARNIAEILELKSKSENYLENRAQDLVYMIEGYYFTITTFLPSTVYKTSFIDSASLKKCYDLVSLSLPHYALLSKAINENSLIYKTKKDVVLLKENPDDWDIGNFSFITRRLSCAYLIEEKKFVKYALQLINGRGLAYNLFSHIVVAKAINEEDFRTNVINLIATMYKLKGWFVGFLYHLLILCSYIIPKPICKYAYKKKIE